jgi:hypothetical protein
MIEFVGENSLEEDLEVILNAINGVGVMNKGIALEFKKRLPDYF